MPKKRVPSHPSAEAHRLETFAHQLHEKVDATHKAAHNLRLRATAAREQAQQTSKRAKAQVVAAMNQTNRVHKTEETGAKAHQKIRRLKG